MHFESILLNKTSIATHSIVDLAEIWYLALETKTRKYLKGKRFSFCLKLATFFVRRLRSQTDTITTSKIVFHLFSLPFGISRFILNFTELTFVYWNENCRTSYSRVTVDCVRIVHVKLEAWISFVEY